jgi:cytochrome c1
LFPIVTGALFIPDSIAVAAGRAAALSIGLLGLAACNQVEPSAQRQVIGGDPEAGRAAIAAVACGICHVIPGVRGANGIVGPSLAGFARRQLIGGIAPNQPTMLVQWVKDAPSIAPSTGMPDMPLTDAQARDVAAYLFTLR